MTARPLLPFLLLALALPTAPRIAQSMVDEREGAVALPAGSTVRVARGNEAVALNQGIAWRRFTARHGAWRASWNAATGTPHRAAGPPLALPGYSNDGAGVDRAVRAFIAREPALFRAPTLETVACRRLGDVWTVSYRQTFRGLRILFDDWEFRVHASGRLMAFGADARPTSAEVPAHPLVVWAAAREAAHEGVPFDPAVDRVEGGELVLVPDTGAPGGLRLAHRALVVTEKPLARWNTLVDAMTGEVLWRHDDVCQLIGGTVSGDVHPVDPFDALVSRAFAHLRVGVGDDSAFTDEAGSYSAPAAGTVAVTATLAGKFCQVVRWSDPNAAFEQTVTDPATVDIDWSDANSQVSERNAYYHVNLAHDFVKAIEPTYAGADEPVTCYVDDPLETCNAFGGRGFIIFLAAGDGCPNTATMPDAVYHEYAHNVDDHIYTDAGADYSSLLLSESLADVFAVYLQDDPVQAQGLWGPGTFARNHAGGYRWPADQGTPYVSGEILGGALWDLRQAIGAASARRLWHFAKRAGAGDATDFGVAMEEFFFEILVQDDDDGDLTDGTPNFAAINAAFDAHGIGTGFDLSIRHVPLADQASAGSFAVAAVIDDGGALGLLQGATLFVSINGAPFVAQAMTSGAGGKFQSAIVVAGPALVRYYIRAEDTLGGTQTSPLSAPSDNLHVFRVGPTPTALFHDMETEQDWTAGDPTDGAVSGLWVRAEPVGTRMRSGNRFEEQRGVLYQTDSDHTPQSGRMCFVTGNGSPKDPSFTTQTVQGGRTTLTSPLFSAVGIGGEPAIEYWRWYANRGSLDFWQVSISNDDGATWVPVERTVHHQAYWRRVAFLIREYLAPTSTMRLRFVAEERLRRRSLAEGALDDFRLFAIPGGAQTLPASLAGVAAESRLAMGLVGPSPSRGPVALRYVLPRAGDVVVSIFDAMGRRVRELERGPRTAGEHFLSWDGRDQNGRVAASGVYFARIVTAQGQVVSRLVRLR